MRQKIAVVGISGLFPGARTPEQFWRNLIDEKDVLSRAGEEELGADPSLFYSPQKGAGDKCYSLRGGFVRDFSFKPDGYAISPELLEGLDDLFKFALYVSGQALSDSGYLDDRTALQRCGVIFGNLSFPTRASRRLFSPLYARTLQLALQEIFDCRNLQLRSLPHSEKYAAINMIISSLPAAVISRALSLGGAQFSLDAACASSLYAIRLACDYLVCGKADLMLAGAVSCADPLYIHAGFSILQAYPAEGERYAPLDRGSKGLVSSEGAGAFVLKRYTDALRDGDRVYAVICGGGLSNDGRGKYLLVPNPKGQMLALDRAYATVDAQPEHIDYLECHATGTAVGDATEISTVGAFFGSNGAAPFLGSVKSNVGHLLTAAGMPGILKIIFAMSAGVIPSTIHLQDPQVAESQGMSARHLVRTKTPWPKKPSGRLAGINCFGFGGANAHLILEQPVPDSVKAIPQLSPSQPQKTAIVGMDVHFGSCKGLNSFYLSVFNGTRHFTDLPKRRWKGLDANKSLLQAYGLADGHAPRGAYIEKFDLDLKRFRIQPADADKLQPQQTLMLTVADNALRDAGLEDRAGTQANIAVLIAMETELALHQFEYRYDLAWQIKHALGQNNISLSGLEAEELENLLKEAVYRSDNGTVSPGVFTSFVGNIMAGRISAHWDFTGPAFTVSTGENSAYRALELAQMMLSNQEVEAVLVGAVDLCGGVESVLARNLHNPVNTGSSSLGFNRNTSGWMIGEGAGAVVLKRADCAGEDHSRIYAVIEDISLVQSGLSASKAAGFPASVASQTVAEACRQVFSRLEHTPSSIGYLEAHAGGIAAQDEAEIKGLAAAYQAEDKLGCALGSIKANIGHTHAASGMAALIKTALCLYYRFLPAAPGWEGPKLPELWRQTPFYVPACSAPWILEGNQTKRVAAVNGVGSDNGCSHIILSEAAQNRPRPKLLLQRSSEMLFPVAGHSPEELAHELHSLEKSIEDCADLPDAACINFKKFKERSTAPLCVCIVGRGREEVLKEITAAKTGIMSAVGKNEPWQTPTGSYFTPAPLGPNAKTAYVYPGSFNAYEGIGSTVFQLFPELYDAFEAEVPSVEILLPPRKIYPRAISPAATDDGKPRHPLLDDPIAAMSADCSFAFLFTRIMRDYFSLRPQAAFGYSIGECSSMLFALGVWCPRVVDRKFHSSPIFKDRLVGKLRLLSERFNIPLDKVHEYWTSRIVFSDVEKVREVLKKYDNVYLTFVNTPGEQVISGERQDCLQAVKELGCPSLRWPITSLVHHDFVKAEYEGLYRMHSLDVNPVEGIDFYSSLDFKPMALEKDALARNSAGICCTTIDFNRLVNTVYQDKARVFVELGARTTCTRWINRILQGRPHLAVAVNRKGKSDLHSLVCLLAKLVSHRVPLDLSAFYGSPKDSVTPGTSFTKTVTLGGERILETVVTEENRKRYQRRYPGTESRGTLPQKTSRVIWDTADLLEFAGGKIANVFGKEYAIIDTYSVRVRLPLPPYLLVSRVTKLLAKRNLYKPSFIQAEYDIPYRTWYTTDTRIPWCVAIESGQCDLLLISYLGIDFQNKGIRVYRLLDCTLTYMGEMPSEGETLRYDISINSFSKSGDTLLFFFSYRCYVGERLFLVMEGGCSGFFTREELDQGAGVIYRQAEIAERKKAVKGYFVPPLTTAKTSFSREDIEHLSNGDPAACFADEAYHPNGRNPSLRLPKGDILMLDRVPSVELRGGPWGLGRIVAEKDLHEKDWYFRCHFLDDQVLPGSLQAEAAAQLMSFYMLYLGMQRMTKDATFQPIPGLRQNFRVRKEIPACNTTLILKMEIKQIRLFPRPQIIGDCEIVRDGVLLGLFQNLGMQLSEKDPTSVMGHNLNAEFHPCTKPVLYTNDDLRDFSLGTWSKCFGPEFEVYDRCASSRVPNGDLQLISRILSTTGRRLCFSDNPAMNAEYDVPSDAWYFKQNSSPIMPYSILMEIALQPCAFFSAYLGSTLQFPGRELFLRNLDGEADLVHSPELRGRTIRNRVVLTSSVALGDTVIQRFTFEMSCDGSVFFRGTAAFGFFTRETLARQTGMDEGKKILPWYQLEEVGESKLNRIDLTLPDARERLYSPPPDKPAYHLATDQLDGLHRIIIVKDGGRYGNGYIHAKRFLKPYDWYFACHFYQDPVMPGSLGVEAIHQATKALALSLDLGKHLKRPHFRHLDHHRTTWKYRGQILPDDKEMNLEVHIKKTEAMQRRVVVWGDANLWKNDLRIYQVNDVAIVLEDADEWSFS